MVRAHGSYPCCRWFESNHRYHRFPKKLRQHSKRPYRTILVHFWYTRQCHEQPPKASTKNLTTCNGLNILSRYKVEKFSSIKEPQSLAIDRNLTFNNPNNWCFFTKNFKIHTKKLFAFSTQHTITIPKNFIPPIFKQKKLKPNYLLKKKII